MEPHSVSYTLPYSRTGTAPPGSGDESAAHFTGHCSAESSPVGLFGRLLIHNAAPERDDWEGDATTQTDQCHVRRFDRSKPSRGRNSSNGSTRIARFNALRRSPRCIKRIPLHVATSSTTGRHRDMQRGGHNTHIGDRDSGWAAGGPRRLSEQLAAIYYLKHRGFSRPRRIGRPRSSPECGKWPRQGQLASCQQRPTRQHQAPTHRLSMKA